MLYVTYVFGMAGLSGNSNLVASSIQYVTNVVCTIAALIWIDRWGRRTPLLVGSTLMMTFMFANAGIMASYGKPAPKGGVDHVSEEFWDFSDSPMAAKGVIAMTYLFVASYAPTWGPVSWIYPPELFPLRLRGKAVALPTGSSILPYRTLGKLILVFGVFCFAMTVHLYFCFPETAGKTLEDVEGMFTTPGMRPWKTSVQFQQVRRLEQGETQSEKMAEFQVESAGEKGPAPGTQPE
ncbi:hypothetical protein N7488_002353 [Penicillium malachiteum]|nr:hypothetical protein N7488_002353 [Penicillium malachiteum]